MSYGSQLRPSRHTNEVFDLLNDYAGSASLVNEIMARPRPNNTVQLPVVIKEIDEELKHRAQMPKAETPKLTP